MRSHLCLDKISSKTLSHDVQDPLQPFVLYWKRNVIPGMGIFIAGYVLFSITNIHTLFQEAYQPCWGT